MSEKTTQLKAAFMDALSLADNMETLEKIRVEYLGKKGLVTELLKDMKNLSPEEKKEFGQAVNVLKEEVTEIIAAKREEIKQAEIERENNLMPEFDVSTPANLDRGSYHPITLVQRQCEEIFRSMGFEISRLKMPMMDLASMT